MNWLILTLISAGLLTIQRVMQKKVLQYEHATEYLTTYCLFMWIFLLPFIGYLDLNIKAVYLSLIYAISLVLTFAWILVVKAYRHMELSSVEPLRNLSPLVLLILAPLILKENIDFTHFLGVIFLLTSGYLLESLIQTGSLFKHRSLFKNRYTKYFLIAVLITSVIAILDKIILTHVKPFTFLFLLFFFASINTLIIQSIMYKGINDVIWCVKHSFWQMALIVIIAIAADITYFTAVSLKASLISLIVPVRKLSTLFITIVGGEIFHEKHVIEKTLLCLVMLIGVYLIAF